MSKTFIKRHNQLQTSACCWQHYRRRETVDYFIYLFIYLFNDKKPEGL